MKLEHSKRVSQCLKRNGDVGTKRITRNRRLYEPSSALSPRMDVVVLDMASASCQRVTEIDQGPVIEFTRTFSDYKILTRRAETGNQVPRECINL